MAKIKKSTKKFQRKVQKGSIQKRKRFHKGPKDERPGNADDKAATEGEETPVQGAKRVEDMSMDEFLDGGFDAMSDEEADGVDEDEDMDLAAVAAGEDDDDDGEDEGGRPTAADAENETDGEDEGDLAKENLQLASESSKHKRELDALKEKDPEFYAYLQATDKDLLDFEASDSDEDGSEDGEGDESDAGAGDAEVEGEDEEEAEEEDLSAGKADRIVTSAVVESWCKAAKEGKLRSIGFLMQAYRSSCHFGDEEQPSDVKIASSKCFNTIMLFVLKEIDGIFRALLGADPASEDTAASCQKIQKAPKWKKLLPFVKSYLGNSLHLLGTTTDSTLLAFILRRIRASLPLLGACDRLQKKYIKAVLGIFASSDSKARVQSILFLRQAALHLPAPAMDTILKGAYKAYSSNAKFVNAGSVPHIAFMASCITELWGLDPEASYMHAFAFIRQLAVTLRNALNTKTKDSFLEVYCWQYVNCLELWAKVLSAQHDNNTELRPLVYPTVQLLMGAARLVPTPRYFPLRLRIMRSLDSLSRATGYYVPMAPLLLEILGWSELSKRPGATGRLPNLQLQLRVSKTLLRSSVLQEEVVLSVMELLSSHLAQWSDHIAFPDVINTTCMALRRFVKNSAVERFRRAAKQVLDTAEKAAAQTKRRRDLADFSPKDLSQVAEFMEEGQNGAPNPLRKLAAELAEKGRQRRALATTESVEVEDDDDESLGDPDEEPNFGVDDEEMLDGGEEMAFANGGEEDDDDEDDDDEEEEDEDADAAPKKSFKPSFGDEDQSGDLVQDFELSDEEEDDDAPRDIMGSAEQQQPKKGKGGKGKGAGKQQGRNDKRKGGDRSGSSSKSPVRKSHVEKASSGFDKRSSKSGHGKGGKPGSKGKPRK